MTSTQLIDAYENTGRRFAADGIGTFLLDEGSGEPVVCLHGVPASAYPGWTRAVAGSATLIIVVITLS